MTMEITEVSVPVWKLLGVQRTTIPAYAMVGWLELEQASAV